MSAAHKPADRLTTEEYLEGERASEIRHEFVLGRVYRDVLVVGDPADSAKYYRERPTVIFEVLSPDTERTDQREKAMAYFQISSVQLYLLVEQDKPRITLLRRGEAGWQMEVLEGKLAILKLDALDIEIPFERIYERTTVADAGAQAETR